MISIKGLWMTLNPADYYKYTFAKHPAVNTWQSLVY